MTAATVLERRRRPLSDADRKRALGSAFSTAERQWGKGVAMRLGDRPQEAVDVIPSGSPALDVALGIGGLPRGRIIEIHGPEGSGKSTLALAAIANAQRAGGTAMIIDAEHSLDPGYARQIGVDTDALIISQPDTGEQGLEIAEMFIRSGAVAVVVIDSAAALTPRAEIEGEMGDSHVGLQARLMSQALRKMVGAISKTNTLLIIINQMREKVGIMFGSPEYATGGNALKFYATVRMDLRRIETLKDGTAAVGNRVRVRVVKNKMAPPFRQAEMDLMFGQGISREGGLIDLGVKHGIVGRSGDTYTYDGGQLGYGIEETRNYLRENSGVADAIEAAIKAKLTPVASACGAVS